MKDGGGAIKHGPLALRVCEFETSSTGVSLRVSSPGGSSVHWNVQLSSRKRQLKWCRSSVCALHHAMLLLVAQVRSPHPRAGQPQATHRPHPIAPALLSRVPSPSCAAAGAPILAAHRRIQPAACGRQHEHGRALPQGRQCGRQQLWRKEGADVHGIWRSRRVLRRVGLVRVEPGALRLKNAEGVQPRRGALLQLRRRGPRCRGREGRDGPLEVPLW